jgi:hypothetical protein
LVLNGREKCVSDQNMYVEKKLQKCKSSNLQIFVIKNYKNSNLQIFVTFVGSAPGHVDGRGDADDGAGRRVLGSI